MDDPTSTPDIEQPASLTGVVPPPGPADNISDEPADVTVKALAGCCGVPAGVTSTITRTDEVAACIEAGKLAEV